MSRSTLRGPVGGYVNGPKNQARRQMYAWADRQLSGAAKFRRALIIETRQGREVEELYKRGYRGSNIHAVNDSPAEIAVLTRTLRARGRDEVNGHGVALERAVDKLSGSRFDVMHLDFCSKIYDGLLLTIQKASALLQDEAVLIVTVQRGRESHQLFSRKSNDQFPTPTSKDALRSALIAGAATRNQRNECTRHVTDFTSRVYRSTDARVTMLWSAYKFRPHVEQTIDLVMAACKSAVTRVKTGDRAGFVIATPHCIGTSRIEKELGEIGKKLGDLAAEFQALEERLRANGQA